MKAQTILALGLAVALMTIEVNCAFLKSTYLADSNRGNSRPSIWFVLFRHGLLRKRSYNSNSGQAIPTTFKSQNKIVSRSSNTDTIADEKVCLEKRMVRRSRRSGRKRRTRTSTYGSPAISLRIGKSKKRSKVKRIRRNRLPSKLRVIRVGRRDKERGTRRIRLKKRNFRLVSKARKDASPPREMEDYMSVLHYQSREASSSIKTSENRKAHRDVQKNPKIVDEHPDRTRIPISVREKPEKAPGTQSLLHIEYTTESPKFCSCKVMDEFVPEKCWKFTGSGKRCEKHDCDPNWVCVNGMETTQTCLRRAVQTKIVPNGDGSCRTQRIEEDYIYIPYKELVPQLDFTGQR